MSEFTKLGGYLIQGQPEVVHDSALSGNGLEGSPLGLSEEFITGTLRPVTQSALNLNIGHTEDNSVAQVGATIGGHNTAANTGLAVGAYASAFNMAIAVGEYAYANQRGIAVGNGVGADNIAAFGTHNAERNTGHGCIFVVGNGTDSANRSDAFKIYNDGRVEAPNFVTTNNVHLSALTGVSEANALVHSNSGTWNGVSAKLDTSAFSDVSGTFLTGLPNDISVRDLNASRHVRATTAGQDIYGNLDYAGMYFRSGSQRPYNIGIDNTGSNFYIATAKNGFERIYASSIQSWNGKQDASAMTAYQPVGDYYSASNPSGFITGVPAGTMNESAFGYDASNNITAYNGSAFKAGDEFPQSATEAIETVTANSGAWNNVSAKLDTSAFTLSALNDANANNIILTASLPVTPDANTLYLIPEV